MGPGVTASGWFDPALVPDFTSGTQSGYTSVTYSYTGPDGCLTSRSVGIYKTPPIASSMQLPTPTCQLVPTQAGYAPYPLRLPRVPAATGASAQYTWDFGDGSGTVGAGYPLDSVHVYTQPGTYSPMLTISYGYAGTCVRTISYAAITVGEAPLVPNIITPNGDGLNDTFVQHQFCDPPRLQVFSRWGQLVYEHNAYLNDWGGPGLAAGLYYYLLTDTTNQRPSVKGWLELVW